MVSLYSSLIKGLIHIKIVVKKEVNTIPNRTTYEVYFKENGNLTWFGRVYVRERLRHLLLAADEIKQSHK